MRKTMRNGLIARLLPPSFTTAFLVLSAAFLRHTSPVFAQHLPFEATVDESSDHSDSVNSVPTRPEIGDTDHRVLLDPGRWKIRTPEIRDTYVAYHFLLGSTGPSSNSITQSVLRWPAEGYPTLTKVVGTCALPVLCATQLQR